MEEVFVLDKENCGLGGKMNGERQLKKSLGSVVRKRLSDITNSLSSPKQDEKKLTPPSAKDYIEQLHKENMALMRLLADKSKIIELTGVELTKMRVNLQRIQQQNWHLAQANSKMLAELNIGKDRLKAMQHELGCKNALLKNFELQEKQVKMAPSEMAPREEGEENVEGNGACNSNRSSQSSVQSPKSSAATKQVSKKAKADGKRQSAVFKPQQPESTEERADNKRLCSRRQSARFKLSELPEPTDEKADNKRLRPRRHSTRLKSEQAEPTEDLFEIEDAKFPVPPLLDEPVQENDFASSTEEKDRSSSLMDDTPGPRRSSIGRPMRKAAVKVQSYKEVPVNIKMRRSE